MPFASITRRIAVYWFSCATTEWAAGSRRFGPFTTSYPRCKPHRGASPRDEVSRFRSYRRDAYPDTLSAPSDGRSEMRRMDGRKREQVWRTRTEVSFYSAARSPSGECRVRFAWRRYEISRNDDVEISAAVGENGMRLIAVALALGISAAANAKQHSLANNAGDENDNLSASCDFRESRVIGYSDPKRSLSEKCENRASEMCIFGFGSRGFKPRQIRIDPAIHAACSNINSERALECVTNIRNTRSMESGTKDIITGGKRKNRIIHLPALAVSEVSQCTSK
jgi:hypothetical protein